MDTRQAEAEMATPSQEIESRARGSDPAAFPGRVFTHVTGRAGAPSATADREVIFVTRPALPPLEDFIESLRDIWDSRWLTNNGKYHRAFEQALRDHLGIEHCNLFANGTLALITGLQALRITGEVITTPYSFVASTHSLHWNGITPVFCDIEPETFNIDPDKVEALITARTTAILAVHVYGHPCNVERLAQIADTYGLRLIFDAAHAFGVKLGGRSLFGFGDLSIASFHATKVFNTIEGGAIFTDDPKLKRRVDFLKNFGFADEVTVVAPGINAKMNEIQAAYGLLQLKAIAEEIARRRAIADLYREALRGVVGIRVMEDQPGVEANYSYFPILVDGRSYRTSRDELYEELRGHGILGRRYFYPLISHFPMYRGLPSASPENLPVAERVAGQVLCLPIYGTLEHTVVEKVCHLIAG